MFTNTELGNLLLEKVWLVSEKGYEDGSRGATLIEVFTRFLIVEGTACEDAVTHEWSGGSLIPG
jgi:hypothetical protein